MESKVYIIIYKDETYNGEYYSGVSYVFNTMEKAKTMLETIKKDELQDNGNVIKIKNGYIIENDTQTTEFKIVEMEIK